MKAEQEPRKVLLIDGVDPLGPALARELHAGGFAVVEASEANAGWRAFCQQAPAAVVASSSLRGGCAQDLVARIAECSSVPLIAFSSQPSVADAVSLMKAGAEDFVALDAEGVGSVATLLADRLASAGRADPTPDIEAQLPGPSPAAARMRRRVAALALLRSPVLIAGEPGSGRDTVAKLLHALGSAPASGFLRIDCARAAPDPPLPSSGTLYLDGIERLGPSGQEACWERIAEAEARGFERGPRILASSEDPFLHAAHDFAPELHRALLRICIELPPLRDRPEDVSAVADAIVVSIGARLRRKVRLAPEASDVLAQRAWPGNLRQLAEVLERALAFTSGAWIRRSTVEDVLHDLEESLERVRQERRSRERTALVEAIRGTGGNVTQVAERLGRSRSAVYRLIDKYGIQLSAARSR